LYLAPGEFEQLEIMAYTGNQAVSKTRSPLKGALLGLLAQGPSHGYELANRLERQLGPSWTINRTSLYRMLRSLQAEGLISAEPSDETNSARIVYRATPSAEPALVAWMDSPPPLGQARAQLQTRMVVARQEDMPRLLVALNGYERALFAKRAEIEAGLPPRHSLRAAMMYLVREASLQQIRGELVWIDASRRMILDLIGS
jgi:DNA-binding PadR family transcriptional regulator